MAGRHTARAGGLRRIGDVIVEHPLQTGAVVTAALVAALAVTPLGAADLMPAPSPSRIPAADAAPVVSLSVPNVIGLTEARATDVLRTRGFSMEFRTESWEPADGGTDLVVVRQTPGAASWVAKGTRIALTVAPAGSSVSPPPQNASGPTGGGAVSAPAGSDLPAGGAAGAGATGSSGAAGSAGSGGAPPAPAAPAPTPVPAPAPQPPAPQPVLPVAPPVVPAPTPVPSLPLPTLPGSPLGVVGGLLRGVI